MLLLLLLVLLFMLLLLLLLVFLHLFLQLLLMLLGFLESLLLLLGHFLLSLGGFVIGSRLFFGRLFSRLFLSWLFFNYNLSLRGLFCGWCFLSGCLSFSGLIGWSFFSGVSCFCLSLFSGWLNLLLSILNWFSLFSG